MKKITIKDIAKAAGVTHATVSNVINNKSNVKRSTKEKILKIMKELGYHPNLTARSLVTGKSNTIAIVLRSFSSMFAMYVMKGIERELIKTRYDMNVYAAKGINEDVDAILEKVLMDGRSDGVMVIGVNSGDEIMERYKKAELPIVSVDGKANGAHIVKMNSYECGRLATEYFVKRERKKIGIILGEKEFAESQDERLNAYKDVLKKNNIDYDEKLVFTVTNYSFDDGVDSFKKLMISGVDAVYSAAGDFTAAGFYSEAKSKGVRIPKDVAVIGNDDTDVAYALGLTTIRQTPAEMGAEAFKMMIDAIENPSIKRSVEIYEPEFVKRGSA